MVNPIKWLANFFRARSIVDVVDELKRVGPKKAQFDYGGVAGIDSHDNPIELSPDTRQNLLRVIEAVQGQLYPGDSDQSNRALLKGVWSCINGHFWRYGPISRPYPWEPGCEFWNRRYAEMLARLQPVLESGGLLAILYSQLTYWETLHTKCSIHSIEYDLDRFLSKWNLFACQLGVVDTKSEETASRVEELYRRSRNHEQYPVLSPHGWGRG
jgi:hypothetical protein